MSDYKLTRDDLERAARMVYQTLGPTPQFAWPLLGAELNADVWVKHENFTPTGAFKVRGGLVYFHELLAAGPRPAGVISATRGNHGQSVGYAARKNKVAATIVVPHGNSLEKNAAMRALGVELIEHGTDFQESREYAARLAIERGLHMIPAFHPHIVRGVATYALELLRGVPDLATVYVPIGQGSGISGMIAARDALGLKTKSSVWCRRMHPLTSCRSNPGRLSNTPSRPSLPTAWLAACRMRRRSTSSGAARHACLR